MKICFLYEYSNEIWSTPSSLITEFEHRGYEVDRFILSNGGLHIAQTCDVVFDIVIVMDWKGLDFQKLNKQYFRGNPFFIKEFGDCPQNFEKHLPTANKYDFIFCPDFSSTKILTELGYDCKWENHWADTRIHKTYKSIDLLPPVRSTRGTGGSQFMDYLSRIMPNKFINKNGLTGREYGSFLNNGKIVLQNSRWKEVTRRIFEGMACGTMVLTDRLPKETYINDLFTENEDIVYYDGIDDCISKINYYLYNQKERLRIAKNGYEKVLNNHTQVQRVDTIIKKYEQWAGNMKRK